MKNLLTPRREDPTPAARPAHAWAPAPPRVRASEGVIDVWRFGLKHAPETSARLLRTLSSDEVERAARFHFAKDRDHFISARATLRLLLALYTETAPARLRFAYGPHGKPSLRPEGAGATTLRFNLAHSHELALLAVGRGREVGVDVEHVRADFASDEVARRFFSRREVSALRALPDEAGRVEAFFRCWTRKEAYVKARGEGLSIPLDEFTVSLAPGEPAALLGCDTDARETRRWTLVNLEPGAGYAAAAAVEGAGWRLRLFDAGAGLFERL